MSTQLPNKPSELIRLAVKDLEACENDSKYEIEMNNWHFPYNGTCLVCLAGVVMAKSLGIASHTDSTPSICNNKTVKNKLYFLDSLRKGIVSDYRLEDGFNIVIDVDQTHKFNIPDYKDNSTEFKRILLEQADKFEKEGM